jgi:hypothetical protein
MLRIGKATNAAKHAEELLWQTMGSGLRLPPSCKRCHPEIPWGENLCICSALVRKHMLHSKYTQRQIAR